MASSIKVGPCGGTSGSVKNMDTTGITRIFKVGVRHGWSIDALTVHFVHNGRDERTDQWGGPGGSLTEFTLKSSEYIISVKGHIGLFEGAFVVRSLKFETNLGAYGPFGQEQGIPFELPATNGKIIGFYARSGRLLDALGVYVNKDSSGVVLSKKVGPCGGAGGSAINMDITGINRIVKVSVRHGWAIDALTVCFVRNDREECTERWGGQGGTLSEFTLQPFEYIISVKGHTGPINGAIVVRSLKFQTNLGCYGPYGKEEGVSFELPAINGKIIGFYGRSGQLLDALGIYVTKAMDAEERLMTGFKQFKTDVYDKKPEVFGPLKEGQSPKFMLFACSDSRVCPSITLGLQPGEAFAVRNIANIVPPFDKTKYASVGSAIEYATIKLQVDNIVVVGHSDCGGIKGLMKYKYDGNNITEFIEDWMKIGFPARKKVLAEHGSKSFVEQCAICEKESVKVSLENLKTYPFVMDGVKKGTLKLFGAYYNFMESTFQILK